MQLLEVSALSRIYGEKTLFDNIQFSLSYGQKAGIIARNGAGKTTLLNILVGNDSPDAGEIKWMSNVKIAFLNQQDDFSKFETIHEALYSSEAKEIQAIAQYEQFLASEPDLSIEQNLNQLQNLTAEIDALEAWDFETKIKTITSKLNIPATNTKINTLSGGQVKRLALAKALVQDADIYILDEPTNHLDFDMIEWLEFYLSNLKASILLVTHDRYFLETVVDQIFELEFGNLYVHPGNYAKYLESKMHREQVQSSTAQKAKSLMKVELDWLRRQPKARTTKNKARVDAFDDVKETAYSVKSHSDAEFGLKMNRLGGKVMELKKVYKSYGDTTILDGFDYTFRRAEKLGIVGKNGTGKSTFLKLLTEEILPDSGKVRPGDTIVFGHFKQDGIHLDPEKTVLEAIQDVAEFMELDGGKQYTAAELLNRFNFPYAQHRHFVRKLSGGERKRLQLLLVLMKAPNFLILDEPTNDLDLPTLQILEEYLAEFGGCLIIVSHDRYFLDRLVEHLFIFEGDGKIKDFNGNYTQYQAYIKQEAASKDKEKKQLTESTSKQEYQNRNNEKKLSYKEKVEFDQLEKDIFNLEEEKQQLEQVLSEGSLEGEELINTSSRFGEIQAELEEKEMRWLELDEKQ